MRRRTLAQAGIALFLAISLPSCSSSTGPESSPLTGEWAWVRSTGGIAGVEVTPQSAGYTMMIRFLEAGVVELVKDEVLQDQTGFATDSRLDENGDIRWYVRYDDPILGFPEQEYRLTGADSLQLVDPCCDGFVYEFVRAL